MYVRDPNKKRMAEAPLSRQGVQLQRPNMPQMSAAPSMGDQLTAMAAGKVADKAYDKYADPLVDNATQYVKDQAKSGWDALTNAINPSKDVAGSMLTETAKEAGTEGMMSKLGTMFSGGTPSIIDAALLGKVFGFFSKGGLVGPLAGAMYKTTGADKSDTLNLKFDTQGSYKE